MSTSETQDENHRKPELKQSPASSSANDPLGPVLESFLGRFRQGERPSLTEYIERYPGLADQIRELLPALVEMEQLGSLGPSLPGAAAADNPGTPSATLGHDPADGPVVARAVGPGPWPQRLGDYRILRCIGEGGMGVVYEAVRESLKSRVALKVMHPRFRASAGYVRRFHNEARSAAQLHHTNIVSVFDYGEHDGVCYYAMQYIAGHSLDEILADVRRLRANQEKEKAAPVEAEPTADSNGHPAPRQAVEGLAQTEAASDPLMRTVTHGLLTGKFAKGIGAALDLEGSPPPVTEPIEPATRARADATNDLGLALGPAQAPPTPSTGDADRPRPDSASGSVSSSLAGQGEDRYHREVARLGAQVADALAHAHQRGVLHRDIKPSNLLLDAVGNVWVTDFGLAKFEEGEDLSQSQDVVGTLRYMAPERFRGISDQRCDVYALGASLYELLTLRPVFESADRLRLIDQIVHDPPAPPRQLDRCISRDLETIVLKALAKDPKDRFATADELAAELRRFLENRPIRSRPVGPAEQFWRWCRRNPALAAANITAAILTTLLAIGSTMAAWTYRDQLHRLDIEQGNTQANLDRAVKAERTATERLGETLKAEHQARLALGQSLVSEGRALQRTGLIGQRFESLDRLARAAQVLGTDSEGRKRLPDMRNQAITALGLTDLRVRRQHDCGNVFGIMVDAGLERYAVMEHSGAVSVHRLDDDRELVRLPAPDQLHFWYAWPAFSPDGELLVAAYGGGDLMRVWHLGRRELLGTLPGRTTLAFHPDGRRLLFDAAEGDIGVWDRDERRVVRRLSLPFAPISLALDPGGRRLAVSSRTEAAPRVVILELESGRVLADWRSQVGNGTLAWSADGQLLAVCGGGGNPRIYVWNVHSGALSSILQGHTDMIVSAQFAHTGYLLATTSQDSTTRLWDAVSGEPLATAPGEYLGFSPDDRRLAFRAGGTVGVWDVALAPECVTLHPGMLGNRSEARNSIGVFSADVSPDSRLVGTSDEDGVRLWESDTGRELAHLKAGVCETVLFHADGQGLISSSRWGVYRWPIRPDTGRRPDAICVGPPELVRESANSQWSKAAWMPDHRTLALLDNPNSRVLLVDSSHPHPAWSRATALDSGENRRMTSVAVSPEGRWLAVGGWKEAGVRVWDLRRRRLERILRPNDALGDMHFFAGFSPDGRWLVSCTHSASPAFHFWRVGTWELGLRIVVERSGAAWQRPAFTRDGRMMALAIAPDQMLLADAVTGRELARLTTLEAVAPAPLVFSPDGTKLIAGTNQKTVLVWDLRRVRDQLAPLGLDWVAPPYPTAAAGSDVPGPAPPPRPVRVVGEVTEPQARRAAELAEMNRRLAANPDDAEALIHRGWLFTEQKQWRGASVDLEHLLRVRPGDSNACWLLGEAYQEAGKLPAALAAFSRLLERSPDDRDARFQRGLLALTVAQPAVAADDFTRILAAEPDLDPARYRRAQALIRLGRHREALADLDTLIRKDPAGYALYELRGIAREVLGDHEPARADREKASALLPQDPTALNDAAWAYATGPIDRRDPERAVALARRAVALAPGEQVSLNTLGVALYRAAQYAEAIPILEQSLAAGKGEFDAFDLFFLAMAHQKLGHPDQARASFDRALRWWDEHKNLPAQYVSELTSFRAEAERTLAAAVAALPVDIFAP
jgi:eukaryotic-like serine/threonine-protein kinase